MRLEWSAVVVDMTCVYCGEDWSTGFESHWMLDAQTIGADAFVVFIACCEGARDDVGALGYEAVTGRSVESVIAELTGRSRTRHSVKA